MARIFLISFLIIFCLALPTRAENISTQHITTYPLNQITVGQITVGQATANKTGINAYRRNLDRLRSSQTEASRSQLPILSPTAKDLNESPQPTATNSPNTELSKNQPQRQQSQSAKQQFSFKRIFQKNNFKKDQLHSSPSKAGTPTEKNSTTVAQERPTQPQGMSAYEMVQAARQPYSDQEGTSFSPPSLPKITPNQLSKQLSERVSQIHTSIRQQPDRLNKTLVEPLQGKITALKEQASTTAQTAFKEQIENRGLSRNLSHNLSHNLKGRELIDSIGVSDRINQTKKSLKASMVGILKHVETKAHDTAEQLNNTTR